MSWLARKLPLPKIAILSFKNTISLSTVEPHLKLIKRLEKNRSIRGVVLKVNSPGGAVAPTESFHYTLRKLAEKKPVYSFIPELAASGGYYAACGTQKIFAIPTAIVGSIGVIGFKPMLKEMLEKVGIKLEVLKKGKHKDMFLFDRPYSEEEKDKMDVILEDSYQRFIEVVAEGRKLPRTTVEKLATGELFTANRAQKLGLIDKVCHFEEAIEEMSKEVGVKKERAFIIAPRKPFISRTFGFLVEDIANHLYDRLLRSFYS